MGILQDVKDFVTSDDIRRELATLDPKDNIHYKVAELKDSIENLSNILYELEKRLAHIEYHNYKPKEFR